MSGDVIILEEAAYCDPQLIGEVVVPLLAMQSSCLLCISTLLERGNHYSRMFELKSATGDPLFETMTISLVCEACMKTDAPEKCTHMLHEMPRWLSSQKLETVKMLLSDDSAMLLRESMGVSADSTQRAFASADIEAFVERARVRSEVFEHSVKEGLGKPCYVLLAVDPSGGGSSAFAVASVTQLTSGMLVVRARPLAAPYRRPRSLGAPRRASRTREAASRAQVGSPALAQKRAEQHVRARVVAHRPLEGRGRNAQRVNVPAGVAVVRAHLGLVMRREEHHRELGVHARGLRIGQRNDVAEVVQRRSGRVVRAAVDPLEQRADAAHVGGDARGARALRRFGPAAKGRAKQPGAQRRARRRLGARAPRGRGRAGRRRIDALDGALARVAAVRRALTRCLRVGCRRRCSDSTRFKRATCARRTRWS